MKQLKIFLFGLIICILATSAGCGQQGAQNSQAKNVILMIADGSSVDASTLARWYAAYDGQSSFDENFRLNLDEYTSGLIRTYWENKDGSTGAITDSAPGATAYATGHKAHDKFIGIGADEKPHATLLELAESMGKGTGLVSTVSAQHATPAAFAAHTKDRADTEGIAAQMLEVDLDVLLGGGSKFLQNRADGRDLIKEAKEKGYDYLTTKKELADYQGEQLYGLFAPDFMAYSIDRPLLAPDEPNLDEMTQKAIDILGKKDKGFFLMVEGSKIDWGAHNNDPVAVVSEFLEFDKAVKKAMDYAKGRKDTMVIVVEDHGTGGISIGSSVSDENYSSYPLKDIIEPIKGAKITSNGAIELLAQGKSAEEVLSLYGIANPTPEALEWIKGLKADPGKSTSTSRATLGQMISSQSNIGWTSTGHTGEDVVLYSYLPGNERLTGLFENTEITKVISDAWGSSLTDAVCKHQSKE